MKKAFHWTEAPSRCDYLADRLACRECVYVTDLKREEYMAYLLAGWRRFGRTLFRPRCRACSACRSLRVDAAQFRPDRSQRRCRRVNEGTVRLLIDVPSVTPEKLALFDRFHDARTATRGWPCHDPNDVDGYVATFIDNPFPTQEWCYFQNDVLVGVGYVDELAGGFSAIYFAHDPDYQDRALGTWNVLNLIDRACELGLPHVYLGYYVAGCPSLAYKARFRPNQTLDAEGHWRDCVIQYCT